MRLLAVYEPLVVIAESRDVSERLLLAGPFSDDLPTPGDHPDDKALAEIVDASFPFGGLNWAECQGRPFITRCGPGKYAILIPVGHGGRVKYDPVVETEVVRMLALANKAAMTAVSVAMTFSRTHGRPDPADLHQWQLLLAAIQAELKTTRLISPLPSSTPRSRRPPLRTRRALPPRPRPRASCAGS